MVTGGGSENQWVGLKDLFHQLLLLCTLKWYLPLSEWTQLLDLNGSFHTPRWLSTLKWYIPSFWIVQRPLARSKWRRVSQSRKGERGNCGIYNTRISLFRSQAIFVDWTSQEGASISANQSCLLRLLPCQNFCQAACLRPCPI